MPNKPPQWTLLEKLEHAGLGKRTRLARVATNGEKKNFIFVYSHQRLAHNGYSPCDDCGLVSRDLPGRLVSPPYSIVVYLIVLLGKGLLARSGQQALDSA